MFYAQFQKLVFQKEVFLLFVVILFCPLYIYKLLVFFFLIPNDNSLQEDYTVSGAKKENSFLAFLQQNS